VFFASLIILFGASAGHSWQSTAEDAVRSGLAALLTRVARQVKWKADEAAPQAERYGE